MPVSTHHATSLYSLAVPSRSLYLYLLLSRVLVTAFDPVTKHLPPLSQTAVPVFRTRDHLSVIHQ